jgi:hypothetical protein
MKKFLSLIIYALVSLDLDAKGTTNHPDSSLNLPSSA